MPARDSDAWRGYKALSGDTDDTPRTIAGIASRRASGVGSQGIGPAVLIRAAKSLRYRSGRAFRQLINGLRRTAFGAAAPADVYDREIAATDAGIAAYRRLCRDDGSQAMLRRNVHRLEKGLLMRPRRELFAVDYIEETVDALAQAIKRPDQSSSELCWAADVIRQYFEVTCKDSSTGAARQRFARLDRTLGTPSNEVPFARDESVRNQFSFDKLLILARHRRSVRWFLPTPVPRELVERAMLIAREAPSACNRQPFVFRAFDDPKRVREIADIPMGTVGYGYQIPMLIVVVGQMRNFFDPRDRHLIYIDGALAGMSFVLALEALGLSSCIINWPDLAEREETMRKAIDLEADERPVFLIAVGYPDPEGLVARSTKREIAQILQFE